MELAEVEEHATAVPPFPDAQALGATKVDGHHAPVPDTYALPERDFVFAIDRLHWLDAEITRYRDYEWKITSFHAAFFVALLYLLVDPERRHYLTAMNGLVTLAVVTYATIAISNLVFVHRRLNDRRNDRGGLLRLLGQTTPPDISRWRGLREGPGVIFPAGFILSLVCLALAVVRLLWLP